MTTNSTTRLISAATTRIRKEGLRIRILNFFAIDKTMRARDTLSPAEIATRREALLQIDAAIRAQAVLHQQHFFR